MADRRLASPRCSSRPRVWRTTLRRPGISRPSRGPRRHDVSLAVAGPSLSFVDFLEAGASGRPGSAPGSVDYRLARRRVLRRFRAGELTLADVCDAQRELLRVATSCSEPAPSRCPVCAEPELRIVRFVFGPRLPSGGRAISSRSELARLAERAGEHRCYVVEVCTSCRWNHLQSSALLGVERSA